MEKMDSREIPHKDVLGTGTNHFSKLKNVGLGGEGNQKGWTTTMGGWKGPYCRWPVWSGFTRKGLEKKPRKKGGEKGSLRGGG